VRGEKIAATTGAGNGQGQDDDDEDDDEDDDDEKVRERRAFCPALARDKGMSFVRRKTLGVRARLAWPGLLPARWSVQSASLSPSSRSRVWESSFRRLDLVKKTKKTKKKTLSSSSSSSSSPARLRSLLIRYPISFLPGISYPAWLAG